MSSQRNVLVTGVPRAGTTLVGALLDSLPNTVCLSEPPWQWHKSTGGKLDIGPDPRGEEFAKWLVGDFVELRRRLLAGEQVLDRRGEGNRSLTNYHAASTASNQPQRSALQVRNFSAGALDSEFTLSIKHNGPYLSALGPLIALEYFSILAVVRHPVDVIHSWRSLNLPVSRGKMHDAARCWPELAEATASGDVLQRQVRIYDLICQRLHAHRENVSVLRYEDIVDDPSTVPKAIGCHARPGADIIGKPSRSVTAQERDLIADALLRFGSHYRLFYPEL